MANEIKKYASLDNLQTFKENTDNLYATKTSVDELTTSVDTKLAGKADTNHTHTIANITNLQTTLDGKAAASHTHDDRYYTETEINTKLAEKSDISHSHDTITNSEIDEICSVTMTTYLNSIAAEGVAF